MDIPKTQHKLTVESFVLTVTIQIGSIIMDINHFWVRVIMGI